MADFKAPHMLYGYLVHTGLGILSRSRNIWVLTSPSLYSSSGINAMIPSV